MSEQVRPPVVTILGHVDHGKTTLLDYIRKTRVAAGEHGGITQAIGAYQVEAEGKLITFIDTPGHAAFEKMRSRGAEAADISVLVVAADDGIMPQTIEAIKHIQKALTPMIVAVNKTDIPGLDIKATVEKIKRQLSDQKVLVEEYGGDVPIVQISAKTGAGVPELLETINLVAEMNEFKGDPSKPATGVILEANLDKSKGSVATVLVRNGSLKKGDIIKAGNASGKVRGMFNFAGKLVDVANPSTPVEVLGFETVPNVGARVNEIEEEKEEIKRKFSTLVEKLKNNQEELLTVVIKADKQGSVEAVRDILEKSNVDKEHLRIIAAGTGDITDSDVEMAQGAKGIVIGFNVKVLPTAQRIADQERILIRLYNIIYELADEMEDVVETMLKPGVVEEVFGRAQIIAEFPFGKNEKIAGCKVVEGVISKGPKIRIVRKDEVVYEGKLKSIKKVKDEVPKVEKGTECGMMFDPIFDFNIGDIIESFRVY